MKINWHLKFQKKKKKTCKQKYCIMQNSYNVKNKFMLQNNFFNYEFYLLCTKKQAYLI